MEAWKPPFAMRNLVSCINAIDCQSLNDKEAGDGIEYLDRYRQINGNSSDIHLLSSMLYLSKVFVAGLWIDEWIASWWLK